MIRRNYFIAMMLLGLLTALSGCAVKEAAKKFIGTSTQTLEARRGDGLSKSFFCTYQDCFEAILSLGREKDPAKPWVKKIEPDPGVFDIFISDLYASPPYIILMGIEGNVDTTEVGIFFERTTHETIRVDVSSLSSSAKRTAAAIIFEHLENYFKAAE